MLSFYLCVLACRAFSNLEEISYKSTMITGGVLVLLCIYLQSYSDEKYVIPDDFTCIYFSLILILIYLIVFAVMRKVIDKSAVSAVLVGVVFIELFLNVTTTMNLSLTTRSL
jgi:uncharacterized membrane protein YfhO